MELDDDNEDVREDLGYLKKKQKSRESPYRHLPAPKYYEREAEDVILLRKEKNIQLLKELEKMADVFRYLGSCVQMTIKGFSFDFFPATDTYFIHSKNTYGCGIERLKKIIERRLQTPEAK